MDKQTIKAFYVIGIAVRTSNQEGKAAQDIPALWNRFMGEGVMERIPAKTGADIYCIYTEYEKDHTAPYTAILGCRVSNIDDIPEGMVGIRIETADYIQFIANGNPQHGSVFNEWTRIWNSDLPRTFTADYEVYGTKSHDPEHAEIDIFVAIG